MYHRLGLAHTRRPLCLLPALAAALSLTACGVSFRDSFDGGEVFKGMSLIGDRRPGVEMTLDVSVSQVYPVPLRVVCYYEDSDRLTEDQKQMAFEERSTVIGETTLEPAPDRRPDEEAPVQALIYRFSIPKPGRYFLACLTPAAAENGWGMSVTIKE